MISIIVAGVVLCFLPTIIRGFALGLFAVAVVVGAAHAQQSMRAHVATTGRLVFRPLLSMSLQATPSTVRR